jgi:tRNA (cmo5U34)-methyltransferase
MASPIPGRGNAGTTCRVRKQEKAEIMSGQTHYDALFSGVIGQDYEMLKLICPLMTEMSRLVGEAVRQFPATQQNTEDKLKVVELGGGTGITTLALLTAREGLHIVSVDNEPTMQNQAKQHLKQWHDEGSLTFNSQDALSALQAMASSSVDMVASAYTLHNFLDNLPPGCYP